MFATSVKPTPFAPAFASGTNLLNSSRSARPTESCHAVQMPSSSSGLRLFCIAADALSMSRHALPFTHALPLP
jgi:hypothetical protein